MLLQNKLNVKEGDKVALLLENSPLYAFLVMALHLVKAVAVHLSHAFPEQLVKDILNEIHSENENPLNTSDNTVNKILLTDRPEKTGFKGVRGLEIVDVRKFFSEDMTLAQINDLHAFLPDTNAIPPISLDLNQITNVVFTSGSASSGGKPRAVVHSYGNHYHSALGSNRNIRLKKDDLWLIALPLFHVSGLSILYRAALMGAGVVFMSKSQWDPKEWEEIFSTYAITHVSLVSTQLYRLLQNKELSQRLIRLKAILLGGSEISYSLLQEARRLGLNLYCSYGSSEMSSQIATTPSSYKNSYFSNAGEAT